MYCVLRHFVSFYWSIIVIMAAQNVSINKSDIKSIIYDNKLPPNLEKRIIKITYKLLSDVFLVISDVENPLSPQDVLIPCLNLMCGWDVTDVVGRPSNFVRNKLNKINNKKKPICLQGVHTCWKNWKAWKNWKKCLFSKTCWKNWKIYTF